MAVRFMDGLSLAKSVGVHETVPLIPCWFMTKPTLDTFADGGHGSTFETEKISGPLVAFTCRVSFRRTGTIPTGYPEYFTLSRWERSAHTCRSSMGIPSVIEDGRILAKWIGRSFTAELTAKGVR